MSELAQEQETRTPRLSEDWLAVIIGLALVCLTWVGAIVEIPWPLFGFLK